MYRCDISSCAIVGSRRRDGVLELAILGLLKEQELHGYELKKRLTDTFGPFSRVSFGSLYPALRRLEEAGAVNVAEGGSSGAPIPTTGSLGGELAAFRARRATGSRDGPGPEGLRHHATGRGAVRGAAGRRGRFAGGRPAFNLRLAFARYLPADARLGLLERRRAAAGRAAGRRPGPRVRAGRERLDSYARSHGAPHRGHRARHLLARPAHRCRARRRIATERKLDQ